MSFKNPFTEKIPAVGAGVAVGNQNIILTTTRYPNGLSIGLVAEYDTATDSVINWIGGTVAGVILDSTSFPPDTKILTDAKFAPNNRPMSIDFLRSGIVTVEASINSDPEPFDAVYVDGVAGQQGRVTNTDTGFPLNAIFRKEISPVLGSDPAVWLIIIT